jgi:hypothetical protein
VVTEEVKTVALAIAKVIARKGVEDEPAYRRGNDFDRMMIVNTAAPRMVEGCLEIAEAAIKAVRELT